MFFRRLANSIGLVTRSIRSISLSSPSRDYRYMDFKNKVAVITGGTRGIGLAVAEELLLEGVSRLVITGRDFKVGAKSLKMLTKLCGKNQKVVYQPMDVNSKSDVRDLFENTNIEHGGLDILLNSAGVLDDSADGWMDMMNTNVKAVIDCTERGMEMMTRRNRPGVIVNLTSIFAIRPIPQLPYFCASKAAVLAASLAMSKIESSDVRLVTAYMGPTDTPMLTGLTIHQIGPWAKDQLLRFTDTMKVRLNVEIAAKYLVFMMQFGSNGSAYMVTKTVQKKKRKPHIEYRKKKYITFDC